MKKIRIHTGEIIESSQENFRGVFDPCNGTAHVEMQAITEHGAVSIWFEMQYENDSWETQQAKDFGFAEIKKLEVHD